MDVGGLQQDGVQNKQERRVLDEKNQRQDLRRQFGPDRPKVQAEKQQEEQEHEVVPHIGGGVGVPFVERRGEAPHTQGAHCFQYGDDDPEGFPGQAQLVLGKGEEAQHGDRGSLQEKTGDLGKEQEQRHNGPSFFPAGVYGFENR